MKHVNKCQLTHHQTIVNELFESIDFLDVLLVVAVTLPENIYTDFILNLVLIRSCQCAVALHHQWYNWSHCELLIELFCN